VGNDLFGYPVHVRDNRINDVATLKRLTPREKSHIAYEKKRFHVCNDVYIRPSSVFIKPQFTNSERIRSEKQVQNDKNLRDNKHKGLLSRKSAKELSTSIEWLIAAAKDKRVFCKKTGKSFTFKVNFITLTIPPQKNGVVSSVLFKSALNTWLTYMRKMHGLLNYIWKIEASKDGRLHVHFTADIFLHYKIIRDSWNRILDKRGLLDYHFEKFGNKSPNSTDVHSVRNVENLAAYMVEYMCKKNDLPEGYSGFIWRASRALSSRIKCHVELEPSRNTIDYAIFNDESVTYQKVERVVNSLGNTSHVGDYYLLSPLLYRKYREGKVFEAFRARIQKIKVSSVNYYELFYHDWPSPEPAT
jgi:hypothetical protein